MAKKGPGEGPQPHEFSPLYRAKKAEIQESGYSDFVEFLNWVENVNRGKKKEDGKRLIDEWFNKYSNYAIVRLFDMFVRFKKSKGQGYTYEKILNEAKLAFRTEIYGENIVRQLFGYYGNYLKYLKRKRIDSDLEKTVKVKTEEADKLRQENKQEVAKVLKAEEPREDGINEGKENKSSKRKEPIQLTIQFPEDDLEETKKTEEKDDDPNMDELYKFDPEKENWWDR